MRFDRVWLDARIATLSARQSRAGLEEQGAVAATNGRIALCRTGGRPAVADGTRPRDVRFRRALGSPRVCRLSPHLVYGGDRAHEFEMRLKGASYEEIARAGGGIVSTVKATRAASEDQLVAQALPRLDA